MAVRYPVVWRDEAKKDKKAIDRYLSEEWTGQELQAFYQRLEDVLQSMARMPLMYAETSHRKGVHRVVLSKHNSIYYLFDGSRIEILSISNNQQDPSKKIR